MKVLVTGGTGFIGSHLVHRLLDHGDEVVCLARPESNIKNLKELPVEIRYGDLRDRQSLVDAIHGCAILYHCAADYRLWCKDPSQMYASNVQGTQNILQAALDEGVQRVVYTSTVGCLGLAPNGTPANEETPVTLKDMIGPYKRSKFLAEREAGAFAQHGLPIVIVNPSTPVGEYDRKPTPTGKMIVDFLKGKMFGYVETGMNLVDVVDVAKGHILACEKGKVGEKYILGNSNMTLKGVFDVLSKISGIPSPRTRVPHWVAGGYALLENFYSDVLLHREPEVPLESVKMSRHKMWFDSSRAVRELGLPQSPVEIALERAVKWFRDNGKA
jgi:dihydroflavonol-4-reductase